MLRRLRNNRTTCFFCDDDCLFYLECLSDACIRYKVSLHAYVLMTNHVHLLLTPETVEGISKVLQSVGRRYVQYVNFTYRRTGTLWEGRHKASLVDAENYLLACYRYIELNPVRASMVEHPSDYRWSSYRVNAGIQNRRRMVMHPLYQALGTNDEMRFENYRALFKTDLEESVPNIRRSINFSMPLGGDRFQQQIEQALGRKLGFSTRGRPKKNKND